MRKMPTILISSKAIRLNGTSFSEKKKEWQPYKKQGYRVMDKDGVTIWHEKEVIQRMVLKAFESCDADLFLFGSRASGEASDRSDYDIGYFADSLPRPSILACLKEDLEELPIPAHVELVNFKDLPEEFIRLVVEKKVELWKKKSENSLFT